MSYYKPIDSDFIRKYEAFEKESLDCFLKRHGPTHSELKATIEYLIRHREMIRDTELKQLEAETKRLVDAIRQADFKKLVAELECFKDVLALQRRLLEGHDAQRG